MRQAARRFFTPGKVVAYVTTFALYVFTQVRDNWVSTVAWPTIQAWWRTLNQRPLGVFGWIFLITVVVAFVWAAFDPIRLWRERRKTVNAEDIEKRLRKEITNEMEVERARELLLGEPIRVCEHSVELLRRIQRHLQQQGHYGHEALSSQADRLREAHASLTKSLNGNSLTDVQAAIQHVYECLGPVIGSINKFRVKYPEVEGSVLNPPHETHTLTRLLEAHAAIVKNSRLLAERSAYTGLSVRVREDFDRIGLGDSF